MNLVRRQILFYILCISWLTSQNRLKAFATDIRVYFLMAGQVDVTKYTWQLFWSWAGVIHRETFDNNQTYIVDPISSFKPLLHNVDGVHTVSVSHHFMPSPEKSCACATFACWVTLTHRSPHYARLFTCQRMAIKLCRRMKILDGNILNGRLMKR